MEPVDKEGIKHYVRDHLASELQAARVTGDDLGSVDIEAITLRDVVGDVDDPEYEALTLGDVYSSEELIDIMNSLQESKKRNSKMITEKKLRRIIRKMLREEIQPDLPGMPTHDLGALKKAIEWVSDVAELDLDRAMELGDDAAEAAEYIEQKIDDGTIDKMLSQAAGVKALADAGILYGVVNVTPRSYQWEDVVNFDMTPHDAEEPDYVEVFYNTELPAAQSLSAFLQAAAEAGIDPAEAHDALEGLDIDDLMARIEAFDSAAGGAPGDLGEGKSTSKKYLREATYRRWRTLIK